MERLIGNKMQPFLMANGVIPDNQDGFVPGRSVVFRRLLAKLEHLGIREKLLVWIENFLRNRTSRVRVGKTYSDVYEVTSGVPQGLSLGSILFIMHVADIFERLSTEVREYADDTKNLGKSSRSGEIQEDLVRIIRWTDKWLLTLNAEK